METVLSPGGSHLGTSSDVPTAACRAWSSSSRAWLSRLERTQPGVPLSRASLPEARLAGECDRGCESSSISGVAFDSGCGCGCDLAGLVSRIGVPLRFLTGFFASAGVPFLGAPRFVGLLDLLLVLSFSGTVVVRVMRLPGLPSRGSASTVTLMRHGLASPAPPGVSRMRDLVGVAWIRGRPGLRGEGDRVTLPCRFIGECLSNGDVGSSRGSGDESLLEGICDVRTSLSRAMVVYERENGRTSSHVCKINVTACPSPLSLHQSDTQFMLDAL